MNRDHAALPSTKNDVIVGSIYRLSAGKRQIKQELLAGVIGQPQRENCQR